METNDLKRESWSVLSPMMQYSLAQLAMRGHWNMPSEIKKFIDDSHLAELLQTVESVTELNQGN